MFDREHEAQTITPGQAINVIFKSGFSTRDTVSDLNPRGYGMDVVDGTYLRYVSE